LFSHLTPRSGEHSRLNGCPVSLDHYTGRRQTATRDGGGRVAGLSQSASALSLHLYKKAGKDGQKIAGHASEGMTRNYQRDHEEIVWSEAIPDLNISEITG